MANTQTQRKTRVPLPENTRMCTGTAQWLLEKQEDGDPPKYKKNNLALFICGQDAFTQIAADLKKAKSSIDIICWGFDPAMELTRSKSVWPRGDTWGGLLKEVAEGKYNGGKPVQVRLLSWYGFIGNKGTNNMPGAGRDADYELKQAPLRGMAAAVSPGGRLAPLPPPTDPKDQREVFNAHWYRDAFNGTLQNISIRTRDGDSKAVEESLEGEAGKRGLLETQAMELVPTDHQKTLLIDYDHEGGCDAVGYVMGLNSVTDYWDTHQHLFHDPLRGEGWEGDTADGHPGLKPYQDYACRIQGEALVAVSKNFTDAWNRAKGDGKGKGSPLARTHDLNNAPAGLAKGLKGKPQQAQIVRTQPEEKEEKTIKRLYQQATSFARQYIYVENQYFQYTEWAEQLKGCREGHVKGWQAAGKSPADLHNLHVMVVIPTPERAQMVPRTHDTVKALGHGASMPNQDKRIEQELKQYREDSARYEQAMAAREKALREARARPQGVIRYEPNLGPPPRQPAKLSDLAKESLALEQKGDIRGQLDALGMRTLVGSLWTFDENWRTTQRKDIALAKEWEGMPQAAPRHKALVDRLNKGRYREIYIHSKLMVIDDSMFTLGSANLNLRSMAVDAEINIASDDPRCSADLRRRVWEQHTHNAPDCNPAGTSHAEMANAFKNWQDLMKSNSWEMLAGRPLQGFLVPFHDDRTSDTRLG